MLIIFVLMNGREGRGLIFT